MQQLMRLAEVAKILNVPISNFYRWQHEGVLNLEGVLVGTRKRYTHEEISLIIGGKKKLVDYSLAKK